MRWVVGYGLYLVSEPHTPVRPPASPCMSSSTRYNPYPTPAYLITNNNWPHSFSCGGRCLKHQISCHNKCKIQLSQSPPCTGEVQTRHEYWNLYVTMLWSYHVVDTRGTPWVQFANIRKMVLCQGLPHCLHLCVDPRMARHAQSVNSSPHAWPQNLEAF